MARSTSCAGSGTRAETASDPERAARATPVLSLLALVLFAASATAADPTVTIIGGADETGHIYQWQITNHSPHAILRVEIPHYRADVFLAPEGWSTKGSTRLIGTGTGDAPGLCIAHAESRARAIGPGQTMMFGLRVAPAGAKRGVADVRVKLADDSWVTVPNIEVPHMEQLVEKYGPLIGLGGIFVLWSLFSLRKRGTNESATGISEA